MTSSSFCSHCGAEIPSGGISCGVCGYFMHEPADPSYDPYIPPLTYRAQTIPSARSTLMGRYRLLEKIGEGGYGLVYKAVDRKSGRLVAIKEISLAGLNAQEMIEVTDSFNREISILSNLGHKHLPHFYAHFTDPEHWYVVMEYLEGKTLEELLSLYVGGRIPVESLLKIGEQLSDVLDYLHVQNPPIVYRDVKPGNIIITDKRDLYLVDFGTARRYQVGKQKDTEPLGSPGYAAPEQYGKAQTTPRTDTYGLGTTLQTLLTGKEPLDIQIEGIPLDCEIPERLQMLIKRMMAKEPLMRPDMKEVRVVLQGIREEMAEEKKKIAHPFAWAMVLWLLFTVVLSGILLQNTSWVIYFLLFFTISLGICAYKLYFTQQHDTQKLTFKKAYIVINKGLAKLPLWMGAFFGIQINSLARGDLITVIAIMALCMSGLGILTVLPRLLRWLKLKKVTRQKQDSSPAQVLQQQKHP